MQGGMCREECAGRNVQGGVCREECAGEGCVKGACVQGACVQGRGVCRERVCRGRVCAGIVVQREQGGGIKGACVCKDGKEWRKTLANVHPRSSYTCTDVRHHSLHLCSFLGDHGLCFNG